MRSLDLVVHGLADVMQEPRATRQFLVESEFRRYDPRDMRHLEAVLKRVLSVAVAVLQLADRPDKLHVHILDSRIKQGAFPRLDDILLDFLRGLFDQFLDAGGVDPSVHDKPLQRKTGDFTADGVEAAQRNRFRRVVDNKVDAGHCLEGTDIPALPADDPAFHLVRRQRNDAYGDFRRIFHRTALNGGHDDFLGFPVRLALRFFLELLEAETDHVLGVKFDLPQKNIPGFLARQGCDLLKTLQLPLPEGFGLGHPGVQFFVPDLEFIFLVGHALRLFVQILFLLFQPALRSLQFGAPFLALAFDFLAKPEDFLLRLRELFPFQAIRFRRRFLQHRSRLAFRALEVLGPHCFRKQESRGDACGDSRDNTQDGNCQIHSGCSFLIYFLGAPTYSIVGPHAFRVTPYSTGRSISEQALSAASRAVETEKPRRSSLGTMLSSCNPVSANSRHRRCAASSSPGDRSSSTRRSSVSETPRRLRSSWILRFPQL